MSIYHYTSSSALLNILNTAKLWGTDISFLNDYKELIEGVSIIEEYGNKRWDQLRDNENNPFHILHKLSTELTSQTIEYINNNHIHIVSFTTEGDYIRQWMAYCRDNAGYCIEFDKKN